MEWQVAMNSQPANKDLVWDMHEFSQRELAAEFVKRFENKLCVYSSSVEQLYSNYNIYFPEDENRKMVILPNPYAHHDTFQGIPEEAIITTGMSILPGELIGKKGLHLSIPFKSGKSKKIRIVPLQAGLRAINNSRPAGKPFLPIVMKGDLREIENRVPSLHLHTVELDKLKSRSELERNGIRKAIAERLPQIL